MMTCGLSEKTDHPPGGRVHALEDLVLLQTNEKLQKLWSSTRVTG